MEEKDLEIEEKILNGEYTLTAEEWYKKPKKERTSKLGFYKKPFALEWSDWNNFDKLTKKEFPIQYFIREVLWVYIRRICWKIKNVYYTVKCRLFSDKQKYIRKVIPYTYTDKVLLIKNILFAMVVNFVEEEDYLNFIFWDDPERPDDQKFGNELKDAYDYIKNRRPKLVEEYEKESDKLNFSWENPTDIDRKQLNKTTQLEENIEETDTKYCVWVVQHRREFWT